MIALRETFMDLFQPAATGALSSFLGKSLFNTFRRRPALLTVAGPFALVMVILNWVMLVAVGFALIYWPGMPGGFRLDPGDGHHGFGAALYFSCEALTTLGLGDLAPKTNPLRIVCVLEALLGLSLVTASISWVVLLYPALGRMRALALHAVILKRAEEETGVDAVSGDVEALLAGLASQIMRTRVDFIHFPIIYYFKAGADQSSLARALPVLLRFAEQGAGAESPERVRLSSAVLHCALKELAQVLRQRFLQDATEDPRGIFEAYRQHHRVGD